MDRTTELVNHPYRAPDAFEAAMPGVYKASTVLFPSVAAMRSRRWTDKSAYTYGLHGTPTTFTLEEHLNTLEGGRHCVLVPSGLAAIALVDLAFLQPGDEVLLPDNAYGPGSDFLVVEMARWGVQTRVYDPLVPQDLAEKITDRTRLVWLEAAGSITLEFPDIPACVAVIKAANAARQDNRRPIISALDNTWGAGIAFQPFDLGVDISMHALTKYPSGGGDVLMGSVMTLIPRCTRCCKCATCASGLPWAPTMRSWSCARSQPHTCATHNKMPPHAHLPLGHAPAMSFRTFSIPRYRTRQDMRLGLATVPPRHACSALSLNPNTAKIKSTRFATACHSLALVTAGRGHKALSSRISCLPVVRARGRTVAVSSASQLVSPVRLIYKPI